MSKKQQFILCCISLLSLFSLVGYTSIMDELPYGTHIWRQSDSYSFTLNYFHENLPLLKPQMHFQGSEQGKAVGEFPLLYYISAKLWDWIGEPSPWISRAVILSLCCLGFLALYFVLAQWITNWRWAYPVWLLALCSPVLIFYSNSFLSNAVALSFVFISWYCWLKVKHVFSWRWLILLLISISLCGLFRPSMMIGLAGIFVWEFFCFFYIEGKKLKLNWNPVGLALIFPLLINFFWILYVKAYNKANQDGYFLTKLKAIWDSKNFNQELRESLTVAVEGFHNKPVLIFALAALVYSLLQIRKLHGLLRVFLIATLSSSILYYLLWFQHFRQHDYYYLDFIPLLVVVFACAMYLLHTQLQRREVRIGLISVLTLLCLYSVYHVSIHQRIKYRYTEQLANQRLVISKYQANRWKRFHYHWSERFKAIETLRQELDKQGFDRNSVILCYPDPSPNILLSRLDIKGFTNLYNLHPDLKNRLRLMQEKGAYHMAILGSPGTSEAQLLPFIADTLYQDETLSLFALDSLARKN